MNVTKSIFQEANKDEMEKSLSLNKEVESIAWNNEKPVVSYRNLLTNEVKTLETKYVVVTIPLGVLKRSYATLFQPVLPPKKIEAIDSLSMGVVNKIFLTFKSAWWPSKLNLYVLWLENDISNLKVRTE